MTTWNVEAITGYKPITTFWSDFDIADAFGASAIKDTYKRAFAEWKGNHKYLTEFVMVLNHRCWLWYEKGNNQLSQLYVKLYEKTYSWAEKNLKGEELSYFYRTLD